MLTKKQFLILFFLTLIPFLFYFARSNLFGYDSYGFYLQTCGEFELWPQPPLQKILFPLLPCGFLIAKLLLFVLCFSAVLGIAYLGRLFDKKKGWVAGLFAFLSPVFFFEFAKFENDQFAYPILIWALCFFIKSRIENKNQYRNIGTAIVLVMFAGGFWSGSLFYLIAFALNSVFALGIAFPMLLIFRKDLIKFFFIKSQTVREQASLVGLHWVWILLFGYLGFHWVFLPQLLFFTVLMFFMNKFAFHLIPLLAVGLMRYWVCFDKGLIRTTLLYLPFFMAIASGTALLFQHPTDSQIEAIDYAVSLKEDGHIMNDWSLGYWVKWRGGEPSALAGETNQNFEGITVSKYSLNCSIIKEFKELTVYDC